MAAPIGHIYLALQILAGPLKTADEAQFIIGTSFPDIRYPANLPRELTHMPNVTWHNIIEERNSFKQGMLFHALVDQKHEKFMQKHQVDKLLPQIPHARSILKALEDQLLFEKMKNRYCIRHFDKILDQEKSIVHDETIIRNWHTYLQNYFFYGPTLQTIRPFIKNSLPALGPLQSLAEQGAVYGYKLGTILLTFNKELIELIKQFYDNFNH